MQTAIRTDNEISRRDFSGRAGRSRARACLVSGWRLAEHHHIRIQSAVLAQRYMGCSPKRRPLTRRTREIMAIKLDHHAARNFRLSNCVSRASANLATGELTSSGLEICARTLPADFDALTGGWKFVKSWLMARFGKVGWYGCGICRKGCHDFDSLLFDTVELSEFQLQASYQFLNCTMVSSLVTNSILCTTCGVWNSVLNSDWKTIARLMKQTIVDHSIIPLLLQHKPEKF